MASGFIPKKVPWTRQPPAGTPINLGNPVAKKLLTAIVPHPGAELRGSDGTSFALGGSLTAADITPSSMGGYQIDLTGSSGVPLDHIDGPQGYTNDSFADGFAVFWYCKPRSFVSFTSLFGQFYDGSKRSWQIANGTVGGSEDELRLSIANTDGTGWQLNGLITSVNPFFLLDEWASYCVTWDKSAGNCRCYRNGVLQETIGSGATATMSGNNDEFYIGRVDTGTSSDGTPDWLLGPTYLVSGSLNDAEVKSLHDDPYQIFQPQTQYIPISYAAAQAQTFGFIPKKVPWTRKPGSANLISSLQDQYQDGLQLLIGAQERSGLPVEYVGNRSVSNGSTSSVYTVLPDGSPAIKFDDTNKIDVTVSTNFIPTNGDFTFIWVGVPRYDGTDREAIFGVATYSPGVFMGGGGAGGYWGLYWSGWTDSIVKPIVGKRQTVVVTRRNNDDIRMHVDGEKVLNITNSGSFGSGDISVGNSGISGTSHLGAADCGFFAIYDRTFSHDEIKATAANPWGELFKPQTQTIPISYAAAQAQTFGYITKKGPWTRQPQRFTGFDRSNPLGLHCLGAIIPAWDQWHINGSTDYSGGVRVYGQEHIPDSFLPAYATGTATAGEVPVNGLPAPMGTGQGVEFNSSSSTNIGQFQRGSATGETFIDFPDKGDFTVAALVIPKSSPIIGDPRVFSKDVGTDTNDHDLMIGMSNSGTNARCRVRRNAATLTMIPTSKTIQADALNLVMGGLKREDGSGNTVGWCQLIREDGQTDSTTGGAVNTDEYNPRDTTSVAVGATAHNGALNNGFNGTVIGVFFFDTAMNFYGNDEVKPLAKMLMDNPYQMFAPQTQHIPISFGAAPSVDFISAWAHYSNQIFYGGSP